MTSSALPAWLADPALSSVWSQLRGPLERHGSSVTGRARMRNLDRETRHALAGLLGTSIVTDTVAVDLGELDATLRRRAGRGLRDVVATATGEPLRDGPGERLAVLRRREEPLELLQLRVEDSLALAGRPWVPEWIAGVRATGMLTRIADAGAIVASAVAVLERVLDVDVMSRGDLAAELVHDAHALDDGGAVGALVLRALAAAEGLPAVPRDARGRRELWSRFGVVTDLVSTTVLTLGLRPVAQGPRERRLCDAAECGDPIHLTGRDLRDLRLRLAPTARVLVCENPRVLEAFADRYGGRVAVVCTAGWPSAVACDLLHALREGRAELRYHGDFDWAGIEIANWLITHCGVVPWQMAPADYEAAVAAASALPSGIRLDDRQVEASWDAELAATMRALGRPVHEEAVLTALLAAWEGPESASTVR
jgi:uncharacterized protein (TIGR02679 family)